MKQPSAMLVKNQLSIYDMIKWWQNKSKYYHIKKGHFDVDLYIRICKAKENVISN